MIVTLTVNPAVDQTLWIDRMEVGGVNRPDEVQLDPAGKGINASRMARRLGWPTIAFGFLGGDVGRMVERALDEEHVQYHFVRIALQTRINFTVNERQSGAATSFYAPGPRVDAGELARLDEALDFWLPACRVLIVAGSLLPGIPDDYYAQLISRAKRHRVKTVVDADGEPGLRALDAGPHLFKPNLIEAERLLGRKLPDLAARLSGARELVRRGAEVVVLSMGGEGALCVTAESALRVHAPRVERRSTVGSGDSLVAGLAVELARGGTLEAGLRLGTAAGAATARSPGTALGTTADVLGLQSEVRIDRL